MKYQWEEKDIRGGRRVKAKGDEDFIIGWKQDESYYLIAADGYIGTRFEGKQALADHLNETGKRPVDFWD